MGKNWIFCLKLCSMIPVIYIATHPVLLFEYDKCRSYAKGMEEVLLLVDVKNSLKISVFALPYTGKYLQENNILYTMAKEELNDEQKQRIDNYTGVSFQNFLKMTYQI